MQDKVVDGVKLKCTQRLFLLFVQCQDALGVVGETFSPGCEGFIDVGGMKTLLESRSEWFGVLGDFEDLSLV